MNTKARKQNVAKGAIDLVFPSAPKVLVIAVALACSSAYGATRTWDTGTGTWSSASGNWGNSSTYPWPANPAPTTGDTVIIDPSGGSAKTVTYAGTGYPSTSLTINSLTFSNGSTADILDLTGGTLSVTNAFTAKTNSIVNVKTGATLNLNGASTMSIFNLAGTLGGGGALSVAGATNWSGGTMTGSGSTSASGGLTVSGPAVLQRTLSGSKLTINSGSTLDIQADKNLTFTQGTDGTITNNGTLKKTGGAGTTNVTTDTILTNTGTIIANAGTLSFAQGVSGTAGTLQTTGGTLSLGATSTAGTVNIGSGALVLNNKSLTVSSEYTNNFGTGNSFNRNAGVTSGGSSGVIKAADIAGGAAVGSFQQLSIDGGATTSAGNVTLALGNIHVNSSIGTQYGIYNKEATGGVTLRGAIQGSNVDTRLSGTGVDVTGSSWTAAAGSSTNKTVTLTGTSAGAVNSTIDIVNNFANTNSQTLTITGGVYQYAQVGVTPSPVVFTNRHVGDAATQALSITNTNIGTASGYQELLNANVTGTSGSASGSGSFTNLGVGATNSTITVGLNTSAAGNQSGAVTITPVSNGTGTSGLGNTTLNNKIVSVSGNVYQYAQPTFSGSNPVNFGIVHVGDTASQAVGITNTSAAPAGYQEKLNASISTASTGINTAGASDQPCTRRQQQCPERRHRHCHGWLAERNRHGCPGFRWRRHLRARNHQSGQPERLRARSGQQLCSRRTGANGGRRQLLRFRDELCLQPGHHHLRHGFGRGHPVSRQHRWQRGLYRLPERRVQLGGRVQLHAYRLQQLHGAGWRFVPIGLGVALNNNALGSFDQFVTLTPTGYNASGYSGGLSADQAGTQG